MMTDLWDESADEDRQQIARMMFEEIVYDLDTLQIVAFTLKPWAERFLDLRAALWAKEQGDSPAGGEGDTHPDDGGDDEGGGGQGTSDGELREDGGAVSGEHSAEKANRSGLKTTSDLCPIGAYETRPYLNTCAMRPAV